jgi:ribonuclease-3
MSESLPFNLLNRLIPLTLISSILQKYGVDEDVKDGSQYLKALVHRSYCVRKTENFSLGNVLLPASCVPLQEESNERLEFLGDSVLGLIVADYLYERFPLEHEGFLTRVKSRIVNGHTLSQLTLLLGIEKYILISKQVEDNNGRMNKKILEDTFEAFLGAIHLSLSCYEKTRTFLVNFIEDSIDVSSLVMLQENNKERLVKYFLHKDKSQPKFMATTLSSDVIEVIVKDTQGKLIGRGQGSTRKMAEDVASLAGLKYYGVTTYEDRYIAKI